MRFNLFLERSKIHEIVDTVTTLISRLGYTCLDADWEAHSLTLTLYVDHDLGIDLDRCAEVSGLLVESAELDALIPCEFNLQVSSPGIERPVRTPQHFKDAWIAGDEVEVKLTEKYKNRRRGVGLIVDVSDDLMISLKTEEGPWVFPWGLVLKATKVVDWDKINDSAEHDGANSNNANRMTV